jgi:protein gp37
MAEKSGINWTDASFAPWLGCTRISPACDRCYAAAIDKRAGRDLWAPGAERKRTSRDYWRQPLKWQAEAARTGIRRRVFSSHLSDLFDNRAHEAWRADFWELVRDTPDLTWMVLTKRPQLIPRMIPAWWGDGPPNVWLGATVENQAEARRRIPHLLAAPAAVHWLSVEPLLEALDLRPWVGRLGWAIVGGESGGGARVLEPAWARAIRDQCAETGTAFWFKQAGSNHTAWPGVTGHGDRLDQFPADLRIRELPVLGQSSKSKVPIIRSKVERQAIQAASALSTVRSEALQPTV